ncbi:MAG: hypothetical protein M3Q45_15005 [Chloroflexota bacterium]|nr:hypothetical protein [Chloroflexota bacterium]
MNFSLLNRSRQIATFSVALIVTLALGACAGMDPSSVPFIAQFIMPTPTLPPTPTRVPTATPLPTNTPKPGETAVPATATPAPTPQVTIPSGFSPVADQERGYSLAVPGGWTALDLRGSQIQQLAGMVGQAAQVTDLQAFLDTPEGQPIGVVYITDLTNAMFGGLPTLLNVSVIDAPGYTAETAVELIQGTLEDNMAMLGDVTIDDVTSDTVNGLPAVRSSATANLAQFGVNASVYAKVVGLIANDKIYILTLGTQENQRGAKEPVFEQIIGTFRPE